jgi:hypothetical protein
VRIAIDLGTAPVAPRIVDPDDFESFKVVVSGRTDDPLLTMTQIGRLGRLTAGGDVFVERAVLASLPGSRGDDPEWNDGVERMSAYAARNGWIDERGAIRAHVEREA